MTQHYDQDHILGYVEGELTDDQRARFEALLENDHELRQLVSQMKLDRQALRSLGTQPAPVGLIDQVIQTHERAALLGDPAAPEPLPLSMPVNRWKLRRVVAYAGVAAVLLLSFGLVLQTLIPPGLLNYKPQLAQTQTGSDASGNPVPDLGSGLALLDEDEVYDQPDARALGRGASDRKPRGEKSLAAASTPFRSKINESAKRERVVSTADSLTDSLEAEQMSAESDDTAAAPVSALAMKTPGTPLGQDRTDSLKETALQPDNAGPKRSEGTDTLVLKQTTPGNPTPGYIPATGERLALTKTPTATDRTRFKKDVLADAFAGYSDATVTDRTQLRINAPSPTQARRDIRDWALANSARLIEDPSSGAFNSAGISEAVVSRRSRTQSTAAANPTPHVGPTRYVVVVDPQQVPDLLAYLNRSKGQHAELVTLAEEVTAPEQTPTLGTALIGTPARQDHSPTPAADHVMDMEGDTGGDIGGGTGGGTGGIAHADKDQSATPSALANRLVDTRSGWNSGSPARGMSPVTENNRHAKAREARTESTALDHNGRKKQKEETPDKQPPQPPGETPAFDWSRLLEPRRDFSVPPATTPQRGSVSATESRRQVRLEVIIQQIADGVSVGQADVSSQAESKRTEQAPPRKTAE